MDDRLKQLLVAAPSLVAGLRGNGTATQAFMEGYQRTLAQLQQQRALTGQQAIQSAQFQQSSDRQAMLDRERQEDRALAQEDRQRRLGLESLGMIPTLGEIGSMAETPEAAQATIESIMPRILEAFGPEAMAVGQPAVDLARANITGRQRKQVSDFVESAMKLDVIADNPDNDPEFTQLPAHIQRIVGKPTARLSELQTLAQQPVGRPSTGARNPNREALALRAAQGDKEAERALRLLREPVAGSSASEPLVEVLGPDGRPTWMPRSQAAGMPTTRAAGNTQQQEAADTASEVSRIATDLLNHPGLPGAFGVIDSRIPTVRQTTADAEALRDSLISLLTLENMGKMKGVLSDSDMRVLQRASTTLRESMSDQAAQTELRRIIRVMQKAALGTPEPPMGRTNSTDALTVTTPDGKTYTFPTKRAADQFRRQIGG